MSTTEQDHDDADPRRLRARMVGTVPTLIVQIAWVVVWYFPAVRTFILTGAAAPLEPLTVLFTVVRALFLVLATMVCPGLLFSVWQNVRRARDGLVAAAAGAALLVGVSLVGRFLGV